MKEEGKEKKKKQKTKNTKRKRKKETYVAAVVFLDLQLEVHLLQSFLSTNLECRTLTIDPLIKTKVFEIEY